MRADISSWIISSSSDMHYTTIIEHKLHGAASFVGIDKMIQKHTILWAEIATDYIEMATIFLTF